MPAPAPPAPSSSSSTAPSGAPSSPLGADFDQSGPVASDFSAAYGGLLKVEVQAQVTSASGTVYVNPVLMYGRQT